MKSKKEKSIQFFSNIDMINCPICHEGLDVLSDYFICKNGHNYTISKKGVVCLLNTGNLKKNYIYDKNLFVFRRRFILNNFYTDIYNEIVYYINNYKNEFVNILDLGCGEGTHDYLIASKLNKKFCFLGIDYNKDAIELATDYISEKVNFSVADVNNLPFKSESFDFIINILSPYSSIEVQRVLKKDGIFIKVIPDSEYLIQLRKKIGFNEYEKKEVVKHKVLNNFDLIREIKVTKDYVLTDEQQQQLLNMTPLMKSKKAKENNENISDITIDLSILILRRK